MIDRFFSWWRRAQQPTPPSSNLRITVSMRSDTGRHREANEDCGQVTHPADAQRRTAKGVLALVADGMGGHAAGEVASRMATETIRRIYYAHEGTPHQALRDAFEQANRDVHRAAREGEHLRGMGTTCTALVVCSGQAFSAHVGDSRLYLLRRGRLRKLSEDHSLVADMLREGLLTEEDARNHEDRNVITRALGLRATVDVALWAEPLAVQAGDRYVLCSDGLYDLVDERDIAAVVARETPHAAGAQLVDLANARGGYDNITVGVIGIDPPRSKGAIPARDTREIEVLS